MYTIHYQNNTAKPEDPYYHTQCSNLRDIEIVSAKLTAKGFKVVSAFCNENDLVSYLKDGQNEFAYNCYIYNLTPDMYGKKVLLANGEICAIKKIKPQNRKYPIIVWSEGTNKSYKLSPGQTRFALERYEKSKKGSSTS